jgi:hypothetical protein
MANDTTINASLDAFFDQSVDNLPENHYVEHGDTCDICRCDRMADPSTVEQASSISRSAVCQTKTCPSPHVFHKLCIYTWMHTKLHSGGDATCPMCRTTIIVFSPVQGIQSNLEAIQSNVSILNNLLERLTLQRTQMDEEIERAEQRLQDDSTDVATRLSLLVNSHITLRNIVEVSTAQAQEITVQYREVLIALEALMPMD